MGVAALFGAVVVAVVAATRRRALSVDLVKSRGAEEMVGLRAVEARGAGTAAGGAAADDVDLLVMMGGDGSLDRILCTKEVEGVDAHDPGLVTQVRADVLGETCLPTGR